MSSWASTGQSYGWVAPDEDVSGLEDEYNLAPASMPKLIYIKASASRDERLNELIDRIRSDDTAAYLPFETTEQLEEQIVGRPRHSARGALRCRAHRGISRDGRIQSLLASAVGILAHHRAERELCRPARPARDCGEHRVVTLLGPGGIGKSRLAIEIAAAAEDRFPDGTAFIALENVFESSLLLPTIAYGLGVRDSSERTLEDRLASALEDRRMLIVLDNFEQIVDAAPADREALLARRRRRCSS